MKEIIEKNADLLKGLEKLGQALKELSEDLTVELDKEVKKMTPGERKEFESTQKKGNR